MNVNRRTLRLAPLAAALMTAGIAQATPLSAPVPAAWKPGDGRAVAALFAALDARALPRTSASAPATTLTVNSCVDDNGAGTLRSVVTGAGEGDTVDASALTCGAIVLAQGAIPVYQNDLTITGPGAKALAVDGAGLDRAFVHYGYGTLDLQNLTVRNGLASVTGYHVTGGACVISNGYVRLDHATVSGCLASGEGAYGGGVTARGVSLYSSTLTGNTALGSHPNTFTAAYGGGAMAYRGQAYLFQSTVSGNRATHTLSDTHGSYCTGGGIFSDLGGYAYGSTLSGNYSFGTGGGLATHGGFGISDSTIAGNTARYKTGGGVFARVFDAMLVNNSTIAGQQGRNFRCRHLFRRCRQRTDPAKQHRGEQHRRGRERRHRHDGCFNDRGIEQSCHRGRGQRDLARRHAAIRSAAVAADRQRWGDAYHGAAGRQSRRGCRSKPIQPRIGSAWSGISARARRGG